MRKQINKHLHNLSNAERLWLRRDDLGMTQLEMARHLSMGRTTYWRHESGQFQVHKSMLELTLLPTPPQQLVLARRRLGWTLPEVARRLGVSNVTVMKYEKTASTRLKSYYQARGFTFV